MKDENLYKGIEDIHRIRLDSAEKDKMLQHLMRHTEVVPSPFVFPRPFSYSMAAGALMLMLVIAGGTAFASGQALPGDILYPVKIHVRESVQGFFKADQQAKREWEEEKAVTRIKEAGQLMQKGKLDEENRGKIEKEFEKNAEAFILRNQDDSSKKDFKDKIEKELDKLKDGNAYSSSEQKKEIDNLEKKVREKKDEHL